MAALTEPSPEATEPLEKRMARILFSGDLPPGSKITERDMARNLGVSRIPVREAIARFIERGGLVRGDKNQSVRMRDYSAEEVPQLYELREALEVASARAACRKATEAELLQMEMICDQMEEEVGNYGSSKWANLDRMFHETLVAASHNKRIINNFDLLFDECHYVFYLYLARKIRPTPSEDWIVQHMNSVVDEHRKIVNCIRRGEADAVQDQIRMQLQRAASRAMRAIVEETLSRKQRKEPETRSGSQADTPISKKI
ncbi:MAG: GntR family transcriptional regulator [Chthoniobacterales bacterium]